MLVVSVLLFGFIGCVGAADIDLDHFVPPDAKDKSVSVVVANRATRISYWTSVKPPDISIAKDALQELQKDGWISCLNRVDPWLSYIDTSGASSSRVSNFIEVWRKDNSVLLISIYYRQSTSESAQGNAKQHVELMLYKDLTGAELVELLEPFPKGC